MRDWIDWANLSLNVRNSMRLSEIAELGRRQNGLLQGIREDNRRQLEAMSEIHGLMLRQEEKALREEQARQVAFELRQALESLDLDEDPIAAFFSLKYAELLYIKNDNILPNLSALSDKQYHADTRKMWKDMLSRALSVWDSGGRSALERLVDLLPQVRARLLPLLRYLAISDLVLREPNEMAWMVEIINGTLLRAEEADDPAISDQDEATGELKPAIEHGKEFKGALDNAFAPAFAEMLLSAAKGVADRGATPEFEALPKEAKLTKVANAIESQYSIDPRILLNSVDIALAVSRGQGPVEFQYSSRVRELQEHIGEIKALAKRVPNMAFSQLPFVSDIELANTQVISRYYRSIATIRACIAVAMPLGEIDERSQRFLYHLGLREHLMPNEIDQIIDDNTNLDDSKLEAGPKDVRDILVAAYRCATVDGPCSEVKREVIGAIGESLGVPEPNVREFLKLADKGSFTETAAPEEPTLQQVAAARIAKPSSEMELGDDLKVEAAIRAAVGKAIASKRLPAGIIIGEQGDPGALHRIRASLKIPNAHKLLLAFEKRQLGTTLCCLGVVGGKLAIHIPQTFKERMEKTPADVIFVDLHGIAAIRVHLMSVEVVRKGRDSVTVHITAKPFAALLQTVLAILR